MRKYKRILLVGLLLPVLFFSSVAGFGQGINSGLEAYFSFCGCSTTDFSGNGHKDTVNGPPVPQCVQSVINQGYHFAGAMTESIEVSDMPDAPKDISIAAWIMPDQFACGNNNPVVTKGTANDYYTLWAGYGEISILFNWSTPNEKWVHASATLSDNVYCHIAGTFDYANGIIKLYLNGVNIGQDTWSGGAIMANTEHMFIGSSHPGGQEYFKGIIDEVRIYNRALSDTEVYQLAHLPRSPFLLGNDTILCQGENLILNVDSGYSSYLWQDSSSNSTLSVTQAGTYWCEVSLDGCTERDTIIVNYNPSPVINLGNDTALCQGQSFVLDAGNPGATYQWQDGSSNQTFAVTALGTYWVVVSDGPCSDSDTVFIDFIPHPIVNLGSDTIVCHGEFLVLDAGNTGASYLWQDSSSTQTYIVTTAGTYWVHVTIGNCNAGDIINITSASPPVVNLGSDAMLCQGESILLDAGNSGATYQWSTGASSQTISITATGGLSIWVIVDKDGCRSSDTINIIPCPVIACAIDIPTAFSPNGDGQNDILFIRGYGIDEMELRIFSRNGEMVFRTTDSSTGWDGTYNGTKQGSDVYVYYLKATLANGEKVEKKGNVTLLK